LLVSGAAVAKEMAPAQAVSTDAQDAIGDPESALTLPAVDITVERVQRVPPPALDLKLADPLRCNVVILPMTKDPSDPLIFASAPLDQLSPDDAAFQRLAPLMSVGWSGGVQANVVGAPIAAWPRLHLQQGGDWSYDGC
jgi:hypothetical protein